MKTPKYLCVALLAASVMTPPAAAEEKSSELSFHLQWGDLDRMTRGYSMSLTLPSGVKLEGEVISVTGSELVLDVRKTSDSRAFPKGRATVPRSEVKRCRVTRKHGYGWRVAGAAIGAAAGAALAVPAGTYLQNEGHDAAPVAALLVAVPAGLGYLMGWSADRKTIDITVEADRAVLEVQ